jgi:hypothetical protein
MPSLPPKHQQIIQMHAPFIHQVVKTCQNRDLIPELQPVLEIGLENGWDDLVGAVRQLLGGRRDEGILQGLDEEDRVIVETILRGLRDPSTLPHPNLAPDPAMAAPGLAHMVHVAATGNTEALQLVAHIAEQMVKAGGDMARLAAAIRPMIHGERDPEKLCKGMGPQGESLILSILQELGRVDVH